MFLPTKQYGKTFPRELTQGYLYAFEGVLSIARIRAYYRLAIEDMQESDEQKRFLFNEVEKYFAYNHPNDLDYSILAIPHLYLMYDFPEKAIKSISRKVGRQWWIGYPPAFPYLDQTSLQKLFGPMMLSEMDIWKFGFDTIRERSYKYGKELAIIGLSTFIEHFRQLSEMDIDIQQGDDYIIIYVHTCPLCLNKSSLCYILSGIIYGILDWLFGTNNINSMSPQLIINEGKSAHHLIYIDKA